MIVAISRELGAGGLSVGEAIAAEIGASLLDERTLIAELAARGGFSAEYLRRIDEAPPSLASTFMQDIARATALVHAMDVRSTEHAVHDEIRGIVLERAKAGNVVLIGHGGAALLLPHVARAEVFSLLLHASRSWRIGQVKERFGIDRTEAEPRVRHTRTNCAAVTCSTSSPPTFTTRTTTTWCSIPNVPACRPRLRSRSRRCELR